MRDPEPDSAPPSEPAECAQRAHSCDWIALTIPQLLAKLESSEARGLGAAEARARLAATGPNELLERPPPPLIVLLGKQLADVSVVALIVAAFVAVVLGWNERGDTFLQRFGDAVAIGIIVVLNAVIGFAQERKAERALRALRQLGAPAAKVLRDGRVQRIAAGELVPGDVIELGEGDRVPADARLLETSDLVTNESALTGESAPVDKLESGELDAQTPLGERCNMVFMGTHVVRGKGRALLVTTGMHTELGRIAELLGEVEVPDTPLQQNLRRFGALVVAGCGVLAVLVFVVGYLRLDATIGFLLLTAVSLAVAAIPEGLPAVTSIVLAVGVQRMARNKALVRRLAAVETLGSADVICTDKTGTLTENSMRVRRVLLSGSDRELGVNASGVLGLSGPIPEPERGVSRDLLLACRTAPGASVVDGGEPRGDPTDAALIRLATGSELSGLRAEEIEVVRTLPFDRERKLATAVVSSGDELASYSHGAPEWLLERVVAVADGGAPRPLRTGERQAIVARVDEWAAQGLRVVALAKAQQAGLDLEEVCRLDRDALLARVEQEMILIGLVGIADPPRQEARSSIARARHAGVRTMMITGDHPLTARAIATELGILGSGLVLTGPEIDALSETELHEKIGRLRVVARATAANKLRLIQALQARGHVVAMTGDGVNDAPAIKAANIGVAMGRAGTDVTREAADMVLLDDNYATIVSAIEQGRIVYGNIKRFIVFLFAANAGLVLAVLFGAVAGWPPILTPTQILWINLITNGLPALALGMEPVQSDPMGSPPRSAKERLLSRSDVGELFAYGALMAIVGVATFWFSFRGASLVEARTATFTVLALSPLFHALSARSASESLFSLGLSSNPWLLGAFGVALFLQALAVYLPGVQGVFSTVALGAHAALTALAVSSLVFWIGELQKVVKRAFSRSNGPRPAHPLRSAGN